MEQGPPHFSGGRLYSYKTFLAFHTLVAERAPEAAWRAGFPILKPSVEGLGGSPLLEPLKVLSYLLGGVQMRDRDSGMVGHTAEQTKQRERMK